MLVKLELNSLWYQMLEITFRKLGKVDWLVFEQLAQQLFKFWSNCLMVVATATIMATVMVIEAFRGASTSERSGFGVHCRHR